MFFLISFGWHVAASFAFLIAILTPNWITFQTSLANGNVTVQRGVFYVCDLVSTTNITQTTQCTSVINQVASTEPIKWKYELAISSASIAIGCAGLGIITLWLSGIYFNVRQKTTCTSCCLILLSLLLLLTFCASVAVWILLIAESVVLGYGVNRSLFKWPIWLAVGASGGYLMSFITMLISFCAVLRRRYKRNISEGHQF